MDDAGTPIRPPFLWAETRAGARQNWAPEVGGFGVPEAETAGGGPRVHRRTPRLDRAETDSGGPKAHRRILRPAGPVDRAGPAPDGGMARLPPRRRASGGIFPECTVAVEGYYRKHRKGGS